jgi:hypothetical protein
MKVKTAGRVITTRQLKKTGRDAHDIAEAGGIKSEETSAALGPFTVSNHPAEVGGDVRVTLSQSYHSVSVGVSIRIPVDPEPTAVQRGLDYCFKSAHEYLNEEMKDARQALDALTR